MKSFFWGLSFIILATSATTPSLMRELKEKQLSKEVKLQYQKYESKGDDAKYEVVLTDPHLLITKISSTEEPKLFAEIDHKGIWKLAVDARENNGNTLSEGTTRLLIYDNKDSEQPLDISFSGKITKSMVGNFVKIREVISKMRSGNFSSQEVLNLLENIKEANVEGKDIKVILASEPKNAFLLDSGNINYRHTFGNVPEEFTFKFNVLGDSTNQMALKTDLRSSLFSGKLSLVDWNKLWIFVQLPSWKDVPEGKLDWDVLSKSEIDVTKAKFLLTSTQGKQPSLQFELHENIELVPDWINRFLAGSKKNPPKESEDPTVQGIYKWTVSPKTLPLYSLIPLQSLMDLTGNFDYSTDPSLVVQKGNAALSLLGKKESGLKFFFKSESIEKGSLQIVLAGGRPTFDRMINFYNSLEDSLIPFIPQGLGIGSFTPEMKEEFFKLLLSYSNNPKSADKELVLDVKYDGLNIQIGDKSIHQFIVDLYMLKARYSPEYQLQNF